MISLKPGWMYPFSVQIPVSVGVSLYEAVSLYKGHRVIASKGDHCTNFRVVQLVTYCAFGVLAGVVGGLLGLGGGFIMGPLFLELGVPPQVSFFVPFKCVVWSHNLEVHPSYINWNDDYIGGKSVLVSLWPWRWSIVCYFCSFGFLPTSMQVSSATATFAMTFSSSMSVVEYYLLKRFPVPYGKLVSQQCDNFIDWNIREHWNLQGMLLLHEHIVVPHFPRSYITYSVLYFAALYFIAVATVAAFIGQHVVRKLIIFFGRASLIIFILASTIFVSAISLGELWYSSNCFDRLFIFLASTSQKNNYWLTFGRWCWHIKHDRENRAARVHGIWEPVQVRKLISHVFFSLNWSTPSSLL